MQEIGKNYAYYAKNTQKLRESSKKNKSKLRGYCAILCKKTCENYVRVFKVYNLQNYEPSTVSTLLTRKVPAYAAMAEEARAGWARALAGALQCAGVGFWRREGAWGLAGERACVCAGYCGSVNNPPSGVPAPVVHGVLKRP